MIDTHCHLLSDEYDNLEEILLELEKNNIKCIINGCDQISNIETLTLSKKYKNLYAAIGFHPENIDSLIDDYENFIENNIDNIVAIGEIGLDYHWVKDNKEEQIKLFESQLKIAEKYNKPVIVHSRDAIQDTYDILKKYNVKGSIHAFSGSLDMANKFIDLGFKLGIGGVITFKNCNLKDVIKEINLNNIVLETDSPYMTPEPLRGKKNTPFNLKYIAKFISDIKEVSIDVVYEETSLSATTIFDL